MTSPPGLLTEYSVIDHLTDRGVHVGGGATTRALGGGVSNVVLSVEWGRERIVVKQSLPKLRVDSDWFAPVDRVLTEARAIELMSSTIPDSSPRLLDVDPARHAIAMTGAPSDWTDWKQRLMVTDIAPRVAANVGRTLGRLHLQTRDRASLDDSFFEETAFDQLRIDPYFRFTATRLPHLRAALLDTAEEIVSRRTCLVHGDFSPKNLLVDPTQSEMWVIDFEAAHFGDPSFDVAFLLTHLTLKAVHMPGSSVALEGAAERFLDAYTSEVGPPSPSDMTHVIRIVGCLLAARVSGKSPAEYLDQEERTRVIALATAVLTDQPSSLSELAYFRGENAL